MDMDINKQTDHPCLSPVCHLLLAVQFRHPPFPLVKYQSLWFPTTSMAIGGRPHVSYNGLAPAAEKTTCFLQAMFPLPPPATNCRPRTCCRDDNALLNTFLDDVRHTARPTTNDVKLVAPESGGSARRCFLSNSVRWSSRFTTVDTMSCHGRWKYRYHLVVSL